MCGANIAKCEDDSYDVRMREIKYNKKNMTNEMENTYVTDPDKSSVFAPATTQCRRVKMRMERQQEK